MFSTLRTRFGIPGVISVIALVFAMFGGAYAATNSSGGGKATASAKAKKGPRGPKGAKGDTGSAGLAGPAGPTGAKGNAGANGTDGAAGQGVTSVPEPAGAHCAAGGFKLTSTAGTQYVCNGEDGEGGSGGEPTLPETLPSEQTETGIWSATTEAEHTSPVAVYSPINFPIPLGEGLSGTAVHYIDESGHEEGQPSEHCHGTPATPLADPGNLCIYEATGGTALLFLPSASAQSIIQPVPAEAGGTGKAGALLLVVFKAGEPARAAYGTWAVTAP